MRSHRARHAGHAWQWLAAGSLVLSVAACGDGATAPTNAATPPSSVAVASRPPPGPTDAPATQGVQPASAMPTEVPGPPAALLDGATGAPDAPLPGELGTFTWDGLTSDAPWLVPSTGGTTVPGSTLEVAFGPSLDATGWVAAWAPIDGDVAADATRAGGRGTIGPVRVTAPARPGSWSLQVMASFGDGRNAAWYWRIEVAP
jgi:hypothetical protein